MSTVKRWITDLHGRPVGIAHRNPLFNSCEYEIKLDEGTMDRICVNRFAENIYSQLGDKGREIFVFGDIIDHQRDIPALTKKKN